MPVNEDIYLTDGRWRRMKVSIDLLNDILAAGIPAGITSEAPNDLRIIGLHEVNFGPASYIDFVIWSSTFDPLPMKDGRLYDSPPSVLFAYHRNHDDANR